MGRKKKREALISSETKKSIIGILLVGLSVVFLLAAFEKAGPVGHFFYGAFNALLGVGYYLIPLILFIVGTLFLLTHEKKFFSIVFFGMVFFVLSGLGLIDVLFPQKAGILGRLVGAIEVAFDRGVSIILLITLLIVSLLITLNASIKLKPPALFAKKEKVRGKELTDEDLVVHGNEDEEEVEEDEEEVEEEDEEEEKPKKQKEDIKIAAAAKPAPALSAGPTKIKDYNAPPLSLLRSSSEKASPGDLRANANIIKRTLESFGITVEMGEINIGPKVTRYTLKPAEGVKLARILALGQDLALALAAHPIRIEAPIPGKPYVGIEVPNKSASIVRLGSMLSYPEFTNNGQLTFPLGRDVAGEPIFVNVEKLPHMLVAGATGSGKSVLIHSIIVPMLYRNSPQMLKFIMIDPKRVELTTYEGIPHLLSPVITENKKSIAVFRWALSEMDRRYELLQSVGARNISGYNKDHKDEPLPYIIIVIDELADLMATYGREVEGYIVRLAQMARATGIHLILATQRPSVEVVTGLIKANITGRVALQVASQIDSRTILDMAGAEKLLGGGDLLFISNEFSKPKRVQGAYIADDEIKKVVKFIKDNNETLGPSELNGDTSAALHNSANPDASSAAADPFAAYDKEEGGDEMLSEAIDVVRRAKKASASLLQRRLGVGYARAARILDIMEEKGLIGPADGAKPREVFIDDNPDAVPDEIE